MKLTMLWPIMLAVGADIVYQICAKSTPEKMNPLAALAVTYVVSAVTAVAAYLVLHRGTGLMQEYTHLNWAPFVLGIALVGLEVGSIYMYRVGWNVNNGYMMQSICIMIALVFVGLLLYHETLTPRKLIGIIICLIGVVFINKSGQNTFAGKLTSAKEFVILKREIQKAAAKFSMPLFLQSMEGYYGRSITKGRASRRCAE